MSRPIRVVQYGLGSVGIETVRVLLQRASSGKVQVVGAIDTDAFKAHTDLAVLLGSTHKTGIIVSPDPEAVLREAHPDVVLLTTSSPLHEAVPLIQQCFRYGAHVITSIEDLFYPFHRYPEESSALDQLAQSHNRVLIGTGVTPGFITDLLPLCTSALCQQIHQIQIARIIDATKRHSSLHQRIGMGLYPGDFEQLKRAGKLGFPALRDSLYFLADSIGWSLTQVIESINPIVAGQEVHTPNVSIHAGETAGLQQTTIGYIEDTPVLKLDLKIYAGALRAHDQILFKGVPEFQLTLKPAIPDDQSTAAMLVHMLPLVFKLAPGFRTYRDLTFPYAFALEPTPLPTPPRESV